MTPARTRFGRYEVLALIGRGGFAAVYRAHDTILGREVALKVLAANLAEDYALRERFLAETRMLAGLHHPNVVTVYDVGEDGGQPFFAMELIEGQNLDELILASGTALPNNNPASRRSPGGKGLAPEFVRDILYSLCAAVDYLHAAGIVHRDIKPANVMLDHARRVVLMDLGIARALDEISLTRTGAILGTPEYLSPEQARGEHVSGSADIYALGAVAFALLTGQPPFSGNIAYVLKAQAFDPPPRLRSLRPELPDSVYATVDAALAKQPHTRPPSGAQFYAAFAGKALEHSPLPKQPQPPFTGAPTVSGLSEPAQQPPGWRAASARPRLKNRRGLLLAALIASAGIVLLSGSLVTVLLRRSPSHAVHAGVLASSAALSAPTITATPTTILPLTAGQSSPGSVATALPTAPGSQVTSATSRAATLEVDSTLQQALASAALKGNDVPVGYTVSAAPDTSRSAPGETAAYQAIYTNLSKFPDLGLVIDGLLGFKDTASAQSAFTNLQTELQAADQELNVKLTPAPVTTKLGDDTQVYTVSLTTQGITFTGYLVAWRRGRIGGTMVLAGSGALASNDSADAMSLAQKQDGYLQNVKQ